ncbi:MAG: hypothetical protein WC456_00645 [Patescibacteria group bacterium]
MKKLFSLFILIAFLLSGLSSTVPARAEELEKILTPDQIKNYQGVIKKGNSLYGVRIEKMEQALKDLKTEFKNLTADAANSSSTPASSTAQRLEKILTPGQISLYEKITKVGTSLWGIKKRVVEALRPKASSTPAVISNLESACVVSAIDIKDKALTEKVTAAATGLNAAITARSTCQQAAVQTTDNQRVNLEACIKAFKLAHQAVNETARLAQQSIWKTYQASLKACRPATSPGTVETEEIKVEDGGEDLMETVVDASVK